MKTNFRYLNSVKKEILQCLESPNGVFYGDIVRKLKHPSDTILKHILELKDDGYITKENNGGRFKLSS
jgi:predicted transcriptional regulator